MLALFVEEPWRRVVGYFWSGKLSTRTLQGARQDPALFCLFYHLATAQGQEATDGNTQAGGGHCGALAHFQNQSRSDGVGKLALSIGFRHAGRMVPSHEPPFAHILTQAEALAARRHEPLRSVHLLAAVGAIAGAVRESLDQHRAGFRRVLDEWERQVSKGSEENLYLLRRRVSEVARGLGCRSPDARHVLLALLDDTRGSARIILEGLSVDVVSLRANTLSIAQGLPTGPRAPLGVKHAAARGQVVPVMPSIPRVDGVPRVSGPIASSARPSGVSQRTGAQALSVIPRVGPTPLPSQRRQKEDAEALISDLLVPFSAMHDPSSPETIPDNSPPPSPLEEVASPRLSSKGSLSQDERDALGVEYSLSKKKFPILATVGRNLTLAVALRQADPVVGRGPEIEHALDILAKRQGNNPCLIGAAGVGKTSVARGIAEAIFDNPQDERLVIEIPISDLIAGTSMRGALAGRLNALKKEVQAADGRVVLFFDEIHQLFSGDAAEEISGDLKLSLSRGELPCIGATTVDEYRRVIESDATLSRRFSAVEIDEPTREDTFVILSHLAPRLAAHHMVFYEDEALALSIAWSLRYLPGRCLPDKAVGILDLAGARTRRRNGQRVDAEAVAQVVASQANMPIERLLESDADRMLSLDQMLSERVIGHEVHMHRVARILRRNAAGLGGRRPIGTFLLLGPTGVGKTETAKAIAEALFHSESAMTRIDMAELSEAHAVAKLIGAPPGYVGHDAGGQLTEAVRQRPYQVVLLDEIEKAHPEVLTAFLAVFDEGRMTDSRGRLVDFTNTVIVLTSNIGSREMSAPAKRVGFSNEAPPPSDLQKAVENAAKRALPPELYNRIDEVLPFSALTRDDLLKIGRKLCQGLSDEVELSRGILLDIADSAIEALLDQGGFQPEFGARPLRRMLARLIEAPLSEAILAGELSAGDTWQIRAENSELSFRICSAERAGAAE